MFGRGKASMSLRPNKGPMIHISRQIAKAARLATPIASKARRPVGRPRKVPLPPPPAVPLHQSSESDEPSSASSTESSDSEGSDSDSAAEPTLSRVSARARVPSRKVIDQLELNEMLRARSTPKQTPAAIAAPPPPPAARTPAVPRAKPSKWVPNPSRSARAEPAPTPDGGSDSSSEDDDIVTARKQVLRPAAQMMAAKAARAAELKRKREASQEKLDVSKLPVRFLCMDCLVDFSAAAELAAHRSTGCDTDTNRGQIEPGSAVTAKLTEVARGDNASVESDAETDADEACVQPLPRKQRKPLPELEPLQGRMSSQYAAAWNGRSSSPEEHCFSPQAPSLPTLAGDHPSLSAFQTPDHRQRVTLDSDTDDMDSPHPVASTLQRCGSKGRAQPTSY